MSACLRTTRRRARGYRGSAAQQPASAVPSGSTAGPEEEERVASRAGREHLPVARRDRRDRAAAKDVAEVVDHLRHRAEIDGAMLGRGEAGDGSRATTRISRIGIPRRRRAAFFDRVSICDLDEAGTGELVDHFRGRRHVLRPPRRDRAATARDAAGDRRRGRGRAASPRAAARGGSRPTGRRGSAPQAPR